MMGIRKIEKLYPVMEKVDKFWRSTPREWRDFDRVKDRHNKTWQYNVYSDVWVFVDPKTNMAVPTYSLSYQRLTGEFGPLRRMS